MGKISTHVLDISKGRPASNLPVVLEALNDELWVEIGKGTTDADGRLKDLLTSETPLLKGTYRLKFNTASYFANGINYFYPEIVVIFTISNPNEQYHIPLLISPFGYSTYRGV